MVALYSAAMRRTSSLQATAGSVTANILFSGVLGRRLYGEPLPLQWWAGLCCLTAGVLLVYPRPGRPGGRR